MGLEISCEGRRALVTGGGNGVGAADRRARSLDAGAFVWVNDIYEDRAAEVAKRLGAPKTASPIKADVTSPLKIRRMREETGPVDILVNNAGIPTSGFDAQEVRRHRSRRLGRRDAPEPRRGAARHPCVRRCDGRCRVGAVS